MSKNLPVAGHNNLVCECIQCTLWRAYRPKNERDTPLPIDVGECNCKHCIDLRASRKYEEEECRCVCHEE